MICPHCGKEMPDEKKFKFCMHCGGPLEDFNPEPYAEPAQPQPQEKEETVVVPMPEEQPVPEAPAEEEPYIPPVPENNFVSPVPQEPEAPEAPEIPQPPQYEPEPAQEIPTPPVQESYPNNPWSDGAAVPPVKAKKSIGLIISTAVLAVLTVALAVFSVLAFLNIKQNNAEISSLESQVSQTKKKLAGKEDELAEQKEDTARAEKDKAQLQSNLEAQIAENAEIKQAMADKEQELTEAFGPKAALYDQIIQQIGDEPFGSLSGNFDVDNHVVVVSASKPKAKPVTLFTSWEQPATIDLQYSSGAAELKFDKNEWETTVTLSVIPHEVGVTVATLSNDQDKSVVRVLILVVE